MPHLIIFFRMGFDVESKGGQRIDEVLCLLQLNGVSYGALGSMKVVIKFCYDVLTLTLQNWYKHGKGNYGQDKDSHILER